VVGQNYYGSNGVAPGITTILSYNFAPWVQQSYLHAADGSNMLPIAPPSNVRVINNSWVAAFGPGNEGFDSEAMRRADLVIDRDDITIVNGTFNGAAVWPLMAFGYNSITVGAVNGGHWTGPTPSPWDGPGRQKPEMIGPDVLTSFAAPVIAGGAALMYQVAQTGPGLSSNLNARKSEVIKAVLMAGGNHGFNGAHAWSNNPATTGPTRGVTATPLDPPCGAPTCSMSTPAIASSPAWNRTARARFPSHPTPQPRDGISPRSTPPAR
jgi:hypothetical protein